VVCLTRKLSVVQGKVSWLNILIYQQFSKRPGCEKSPLFSRRFQRESGRHIHSRLIAPSGRLRSIAFDQLWQRYRHGCLASLWSSLQIFSLTAVRARSNRAAAGVGTGLLKATRPAAKISTRSRSARVFSNDCYGTAFILSTVPPRTSKTFARSTMSPNETGSALVIHTCAPREDNAS
jgi:hypothetical protein